MGAEARVFYKEAFRKISEKKRQRIFDASVKAFATKGYEAANIGIIAKEAGISVGSIYSYFESKEDLFLTVADEGYRLMKEALQKLHSEERDFWSTVEELYRLALIYSRKYPYLSRIYLDLSTEGLRDINQKLSPKMEHLFVEEYQRLLKEGRESGAIRVDAATGLNAFLMDNLLVMLQFSATSSYYQNRMKLFLGDHVSDEDMVAALLSFVKQGLGGSEKKDIMC